MSLLIKNWQMADWKELLKWAKIGLNNAMMGEFSEVEEIPPHGRLIDADALRAFAYKRQKEMGVACCVDALDISLAPTIIPAEEGE